VGFIVISSLCSSLPLYAVHHNSLNPIYLPVEYFGDSHLRAAFPQADPCGGGVGQDMPTDWLLGISLKTKTMTDKTSHQSFKLTEN